MPSFQTIWNNYPADSTPCHNPGTTDPRTGWENQCAVRVGMALANSGVSYRSFRGAVCPGTPRRQGEVANAQVLANWLTRHPFPGCAHRPQRYTGSNVFESIQDRTGIIFLANYWQRPTDRGNARTGDHIDLWNGSRMTSNSSWLRVHLGISWDGLWSDFRLASRVLFWNVP